MPEALRRTSASEDTRLLAHPLADPRPEEQEVLSVDDLLTHRFCRRWGVWHARGLVPGLPQDARRELLPSPWSCRPPGWTGVGRSWARRVLEVKALEGFHGQTDWILETHAEPELVLLGDASRGLRSRAGLLAGLLVLRGHPPRRILRQPWPIGRLPDTWLGAWPPLVPLRGVVTEPAVLERQLRLLREDVLAMALPRPSVPQARCWDCPAREFCGDRT